MQNMKRPPPAFSLHSHGAVGASRLSLIYLEYRLAINYTILEEPLAKSFKMQRAMLNFRALLLEFTLL